MTNLEQYTIPSPLAPLLTVLSGVSLAINADHIGLLVWKRKEVVYRSLYFYFLLLVVSVYTVLVARFLSPQSSLLIGLHLALIISAGFFLIKKGNVLFKELNALLFQFDKRNYLYLAIGLTLLCIFLVSLSTPTDADSINYHLGAPAYWLSRHQLKIPYDIFHYHLIGFGEILNLFGLRLGCSQYGAFIQFIGLVCMLRAITSLYPNDSAPLIMSYLSIPVLLFLIGGQKHQLTGIACSTILFHILSNENIVIRRTDWLLISLCLAFYIQLKYSFLLSGFVLTVFIFFRSHWDVKMILIHSMILCCLLAPLAVIKYHDVHNPLSPLLFNKTEELNSFMTSLSHYKESRFAFPVNLFIPDSLGHIDTVLGAPVFCVLSALFFSWKTFSTRILVFFLGISLMASQHTSRFLLEIVYWTFPASIHLCTSNKIKQVADSIIKIQFLLLIPLWIFGAFRLGPSILSPYFENSIKSNYSYGYAAGQWLDSILDRRACVYTDMTAHAWIPRPYHALEYTNTNSKPLIIKDTIHTEYEKHYLVLVQGQHDWIHKDVVDLLDSKEFNVGLRNPFNKKRIRLNVYEIKDHHD